MSTLKISLSQETIKQEKQLLLSLSFADSARILYAEELKQKAEESDKGLISWLIKAQLRAHNRPLSSDPSTLSFQKVPIAPEFLEKVIPELARCGKVYFNGKKIFIDPMGELSFHLRAKDLGESIEVTGVFTQAALSFLAHECEMIFGSTRFYILYQGLLRPLKGEIDRKWIDLIYPQKATLTGRKKEQFKELFSDDEPPIYAPKTFWIGEKQEEKVCDPLPILVLTDRTGAFATLQMHYGPKGVFDYPSDSKESFRKKEEECYWEKDLLETSFQKKRVGNAHYYCPLDQVGKTLAFLLDLGWCIKDFQGKTLVKQTGFNAFVQERQQALHIQGKVAFSSYESPLNQVARAFHQRQLFVELSQDRVGLLDETVAKEHFAPFEKAEEFEEGFLLKKEKIGDLCPFYTSDEVKWQASLEELKKAIQAKPLVPCVVQAFNGALYPHQQEGVNWLHFLSSYGLHGLLADEMGLGKTVQILAFLSTHLPQKRGPCLIVTSTSLLSHWKKEIQRFLPHVSFALFDKTTKKEGIEAFVNTDLLITSYPTLRLEKEALIKPLFSTIILDEAQIIKNPSSQTAEAAFGLQGGLKLALTGTPIENKWDDLFSIFHFLNPSLLGDLSSFRTQCALSQTSARHLLAIKNRLKPFILRRCKQEVAKDLPEKIEQEIFVEMSPYQRDCYEKVLKERKKELLSLIEKEGLAKGRMHILEAILRLRQIATHPGLFFPEGEISADSGGKIPKILEDVDTAVSSGEKVLIFSQFTSLLHILAQELTQQGKAFSYLDGQTKDRDKEIMRFQETHETSVFLISLKAGGLGLNLQSADYVFLCEPWWNEAVERQAIDRAHRIGRTKPVIARRYLTSESIEEKMQTIKAQKLKLASSVLSFEEENALSNDELYDLLMETFNQI